MTEHDPLCVATGPSHPFPFPVCVCGVVAEARADERIRVLAEYGLGDARDSSTRPDDLPPAARV